MKLVPILRRIALAAAALLVASSAMGQVGPQKVLRYAFPVAETGFDPVQLSDLYSRTVTSHIFDGLYAYDYLARPFRIKPNTADGMPEISPDFRVWTVRIRPGIYFDDDPAFNGRKRELVAEDYVYAMKRFFDPRWKAPAFAGLNELKIVGMAALRDAAMKDRTPFDYDRQVEGLRALDRYTIQFKFEAPQPRFLQTIAGGDLYGAVAREVVEAYGDQMMGKPVGTGPFRLVEWRRSSKIVLERNPAYRERTYDAEPDADDAEGQAMLARFKGRKLPMVDRVEISIIGEQQPRWLSFLNKQQDFMERLAAEFVPIAVPNGKLAPNLAKQGIQVFRVLASDVTMTIYNMENPVIGGYEPEKVALRRALNLATDTDKEIRLVRKGQAIPAQSVFMPNTMGYDPKFISENSEHSLAKAKALLDVYGYIDKDGDGWRDMPDGSPLVVEVATQPDQQSRQLDELHRKDMANLGVRTVYRPAQWPENLKNARAGKLMVWRVGLSAASPDGGPALDRGYSGHLGGQNLARFKNQEYDALYSRMQILPDGPERLEIFDQAKKILIAYAPYKNGVHRMHTDLAWPWLIGYRRPSYSNDWWAYVDIDATEQAKATK
jgi:ABC-type transport system substrate-binding protein